MGIALKVTATNETCSKHNQTCHAHCDTSDHKAHTVAMHSAHMSDHACCTSFAMQSISTCQQLSYATLHIDIFNAQQLLGHTGHASRVSRQRSAYPVKRSAQVAQLLHCTCTHTLMHSACHMLIRWQLHACMHAVYHASNRYIWDRHVWLCNVKQHWHYRLRNMHSNQIRSKPDNRCGNARLLTV